ncbi:hypothetical protein [Flavobacterium yafengii]|uniref:Uncharacterized protein n=1 Tax=Flavobacterium yafengii TaxID=3041253 RepID=A0AAW6TL72_9FLAO|nr:hypothetical protein [Flavobacterium yafengii]MDI5950337.1 hypothetical protein [Flavobacterium yafengii]
MLQNTPLLSTSEPPESLIIPPETAVVAVTKFGGLVVMVAIVGVLKLTLFP